jgi:hypothetical protein
MNTTQLVFVLTALHANFIRFLIYYVQIWSLDSPEPEYHLPKTDFKGIMFLEFFTRYGRQYLIIAHEDHKAHVCIFLKKHTTYYLY